MHEQKIYKHLIKAGLTPAGACGLMGNLQAESGMIPNRVEILCLKRLKEAGRHYTDATYTAFVDDGTISREEFLHPLPGKQYGYGLAQWTSPGRKSALYDLAREKKVSIGDLDMQLEFLVSELKTAYKGVWKVLASTDDIKAASDKVLCEFEMPADTGTGVKNARYGYAKDIYEKLGGVKSDNAAIDRVIAVAENELGYLEKSGYEYLDDKTKGAGNGNRTKYWRDVYPDFQGQPWCACFVSWCFMKAFGLKVAKKMLKHWPFTYCPTLAAMTTNKAPKRGSIVLFYRNGEYAHTGLVTAVNSDFITTIEGNASGASGITPNGGGVVRKNYQLNTLSPNTKYFMPDYSLAEVNAVEPSDQIVGECNVPMPLLLKGAICPEVKTIQACLNAKGYKGKNGKALTVDGNLGTNTAYAIEQLQRKAGLTNINFGSVALTTWKLILK